MSAFAPDPIFTQLQLWAFAGLLAFGLAVEFAFSPLRRARLGALGSLLGAGLMIRADRAIWSERLGRWLGGRR